MPPKVVANIENYKENYKGGRFILWGTTTLGIDIQLREITPTEKFLFHKWRHGGNICFLTPMITVFLPISRKLCKIGD